ncbi:hypothetical protein FOB22_001299, partial [Saccharomyces cerevisiae]
IRYHISTTNSASENNESVPSLTSSVSTSSSVYSSWNPPHSPHISSFPDGNFASLNAEVTCFDFRRTKDSRTKETNESSFQLKFTAQQIPLITTNIIQAENLNKMPRSCSLQSKYKLQRRVHSGIFPV